MSTLEDILEQADGKMSAAVEHTREGFGKVRTGRANPQLLNDLPVSYYGTSTPLQQIAGVSAPEARMLVIKPYDPSALKEIERAITNADLGLNPSNDGEQIRVVFPELTEERRKEYVRMVRERAEDGRVAIRNVRRQAKQQIEKLQGDGDVSEDEGHRADKRLQDLTDRHVGEVDKLLSNKEGELLEV